MGDFEDRDIVWLVVDEWDLDSDGTLVTEEDAGVKHGQRFGFSTENIVFLLLGRDYDPKLGADGVYDNLVQAAVARLLGKVEGDSIWDDMLNTVSDETGWCIISSHIEGPVYQAAERADGADVHW